MTAGDNIGWAEKAREWWYSLQPPENGQWKPTADAGALARLRRAATPVECLAEAATLDLARRLGVKGPTSPLLGAVAILAHVLAHVREDKRGISLGKALRGSDAASPLMSDLRLRRLVGARDEDETMRSFREAVLLLGGRAPVHDLASCILDWTHPERGPQARTRLLFAWHDAESAAPHQTTDA